MNKLLLSLTSLFSFTLLAAETSKKPEWENSAEASVLLTSGNTKITTLGFGVSSKYQPDPWTAKAKANYLLSKDTGTKKAESFDSELRGERKLDDTLSGFAQASYLSNRFSGFNDRYGADLGALLVLYKQEAHEIDTEAAFGVLKENRTDANNQTFATARATVKYAWKFSENSTLGVEASFLDNLRTTRDWRVRNTNSVTTIMTSVLSLKATFKVDHLNSPVSGKEKTDTATTLALVAKF